MFDRVKFLRVGTKTLSYLAPISLLAFLFGCEAQRSPERITDSAQLRSFDSAQKWIRNEKAKANETVHTDSKGAQSPEVERLTPLSQLAEKPTLEIVLRLAATRSPMIQAAEHRWKAAAQRRTQDTALPDPRLEATYFFRSNFDQYMLTLSQEIPYPGKLIIAGKVADKGAEAAYLRFQMATRNVLADAKEAYFEIYYIDRAQMITVEIETLYARYAALGVGGKDVAKPKLPESFRAESQKAQLGYDIVLLKEMREAEVERLRMILGLSTRDAIGAVDDAAEPVALGFTLDQLESVAQGHNQELAAAGVEVEKAAYQTKLAHRAPIPNLTIGGTYAREVPGERADPAGIMLGVTIPLQVPKYKAMAREARELEEAAKADQTAQKLQLRSDLAKAYFSLRNSSRLVALYRETLLPQSRQALQSAEELYRKGDANLASVLETTATYHNFELARLRATADFYQNVARIERVLGTALELKPVSAAGVNSNAIAPATSKEPAP